MGFFKKLSDFFSASGKPGEMVMWVSVKCHRCGDIIQARIDLRNELSVQYQDGGQTTYFCRKELMSDKGLCFQRIEIELYPFSPAGEFEVAGALFHHSDPEPVGNEKLSQFIEELWREALTVTGGVAQGLFQKSLLLGVRRGRAPGHSQDIRG